MFEQFPYADLHQLNLDWIIKIAKDFLDQYTGIQQLIENGITNIDSEAAAKLAELDEKAELINQQLDEWYNTHSQDIAAALARSIQEAITTFNDAATTKANEVIASIPSDYTALAQSVADMSAVMGYHYLNLNFTPGFIASADLTINTSSPGNHLLSDVVQIPGGTLLYVPKISKSAATVLLCETNAAGDPQRMIFRGTVTSYSDGSYLVVPILETGYYRFGGNTTMQNFMNYYYKNFSEDMVFDLNNYNNWISYPAQYETGEGPIVEGGTQSGPEYIHTTPILLMKGMTIEYWSCGSSANIALSECSGYSYEYIAAIDNTLTGGIAHSKYTAPRSMFVRLSARVYAPTYGYAAVLPPAKFAEWKIYNNDLHYVPVKNNALYQKHLTVMGDSLIAGNSLKDGPTWITNIGIKYDMNYTNLGINGNTVAVQSIETANPPMVNRTGDIPTTTEVFVLQGGANDKRLNVPIGTINSNDVHTFMGALNVLLDRVYARCPKAKIILVTTYSRYASINNLGLGDIDYANAMIQLAEHRLVPCFDNFRKSGVNFTNGAQDSWMDECNNVKKMIDGIETPTSPTHHFSIEGYEWITPIYEAILTAGTGF